MPWSRWSVTHQTHSRGHCFLRVGWIGFGSRLLLFLAHVCKVLPLTMRRQFSGLVFSSEIDAQTSVKPANCFQIYSQSYRGFYAIILPVLHLIRLLSLHISFVLSRFTLLSHNCAQTIPTLAPIIWVKVNNNFEQILFYCHHFIQSTETFFRLQQI